MAAFRVSVCGSFQNAPYRFLSIGIMQQPELLYPIPQSVYCASAL